MPAPIEVDVARSPVPEVTHCRDLVSGGSFILPRLLPHLSAPVVDAAGIADPMVAFRIHDGDASERT
ncbi:hypothetical protein [Nocardia stercoris]|uniref:Uncharacterized protein n=1 Tax=Nocardia stercoris TaxID=2483361 RepID=A0A3M2L531_9NOCA|nr:hypothetical protein [Nocardia stercoris]RMI32769.1 hypothetical protein EBN03_12560 [Nocardia stercoris]